MVLAQVRFFERLLYFQGGDGKRPDHFESEEPDDVDGVIIGLKVEMRWEVQEFSESLG